MKFWKMNGTGNDFVLINNIEEQIPEEKLPEIARVLCERHMSIGADGLMVVDRPTDGAAADFRMLFYNNDGSIGEMCGNGARCIARYGIETGLSAGDTAVIQTTAGIVTGQKITEELYRIRLNDPSFIETGKLLTIGPDSAYANGLALAEPITVECAYVLLGEPGSPHLVVEYQGIVAALCGSEHLKDADENILRELGRALRWHKELPKGANVNFVEIIGKDLVFERTFERGVEDFTYACGTGTGSSAAALTLLGKVSGSEVRFEVTGGTLYVDVEEIDEINAAPLAAGNGEGAEDEAETLCAIHGLFLTGPTNTVAKGDVTDAKLRI